MDPLSMTASIVGLLKFCKEIQSYIKGWKNAATSAVRLQEQITLLQDVLSQLQEFLDGEYGNDKHFASTSALVKNHDICHQQLGSILRKLQKTDKSIIHRLKFPMDEKEIEQYVQTLRGCVSAFELSLSISGCTLMAKTFDTVAISLEQQLTTSNKIIDMTRHMVGMTKLFSEAVKAQERTQDILNIFSTLPQQSTVIEEIALGVKGLTIASMDTKTEAMLNWLSPLSRPTEKHMELVEQRTKDTGRWLLDLDSFQDWINTRDDKRAFVCFGDPGVGKTFLSSLVIDKVLALQFDEPVGVAWFYCDYSEQDYHTSNTFMASLLRQLCVQLPICPPEVWQYYDLFQKETKQHNTRYLKRTLLSVCSLFQQCFVVLDGLDEIAAKSQKEYLQLLKDLQLSSVKIFITTRPYVRDVFTTFANDIWQSIRAHETDLEVFVRDTIENHGDINETLDTTLQEQVVQQLSQNAEGIFLLVDLQLRNILEQETKANVRAVLRSLSTSLDTVFETFLERIRGCGRRQTVANAAFTWIAYAKRPLTIDELRHALAIDDKDGKLNRENLVSPKVLIESCLGLLVVDRTSGIIRPFHLSLQEYLFARRDALFPNGETMLASSCLTYLSYPDLYAEDPRDLTDILMEYPLMEYSSCYWGHHARESMVPSVEALVKELFRDPDRVTATLSLTSHGIATFSSDQSLQDPTGGNPLHCASMFGLTSFISDLVGRGYSVTDLDDQRNTPLHIAARFRQFESIETLIRLGTKIDELNMFFNTPLFLASGLGDLRSVEILLTHGADPNMPCQDAWTPVHKAVDRGDLETTKLLLNHGGSLVYSSTRGLTALHRACGRGHRDIVKLLLQRGADVNAETIDGWTPLHGAANSGNDKVVEDLLHNMALVDQTTEDGSTSLHRACLNGHVNVTKTLLRLGADKFAADVYGELALHKAAKRGHVNIVELLREATLETWEAQLVFKNHVRERPRDVAFKAGHYDIANYLGLEVTETLEPGKIERAIAQRDIKQIERLLEEDDLSFAPLDRNGLPPFHQAINIGDAAIASILANHNQAWVKASALNRYTPLHTAARRGNLQCVKLCLGLGADVEQRGAYGRTPLHEACLGGNLDVINLLIEHGAKLSTKDNHGYQGIHFSAEAGREDVARLLIFRYARYVDPRTDSGLTPQAIAAQGGYHDLVDFLREGSVGRRYPTA